MKILIILFLTFFYVPFTLAHGGEDHSEPEEKPAISTSLDTVDKGKVPVTFSVAVLSKEINYKAFGMDVLVILMAITAILLFYFKAKKNQTQNIAVKNTLTFSLIIIALLITSITLIHQLIKPKELIIAKDINKSSDLKTANNIINLSKESQLLFNIRTNPAEQKEIISGLTVNGLIKARPQAKTQIQSVTSGRVKLSNLSIGSFVNQGQTVAVVEQLLSLPEEVSLQSTLADLRSRLAELQSRVGPARARLRSNRLELERSKIDLQARSAQLQTEIDQARVKLNTAKVELERAQKLYDIGGAAFKRVQEAQLQVKLNELDLSSAQKQKTYTIGSEALKRVRDAQLEVELNEQEIISAQKQIDIASQNRASIKQGRNFTLTSPISGIVTQIAATSGQQVEANEHILTIMNLNRVWLEAQVFEKDLNTITSAQKASFSLSAYPKEVVNIGSGTQNRLLTVGNSVDPERRTIPVTYEIANQNNRIREGMFAQITIDTSGGKKVINISKEAISEESGIKYVYVFKGGEEFEKRQVSVGSQGQKQAEIIQGIKPGERVVTEGLYQLKSSMIIRR